MYVLPAIACIEGSLNAGPISVISPSEAIDVLPVQEAGYIETGYMYCAIACVA